jgi:pimeloyl-ACP methyl ester carboxylesterase
MRFLTLVFILGLPCTSLAQTALRLDYGVQEVRSVPVAGTAISYLERGNGDAVVLFHPAVDFRYWQWTIEAVSPSYRVLALPFASAMPGGGPFDPSALIEFLGAVAGEPVHLVAHSMGATQAMALASARPDLVRSLVLVEPGGSPDPSVLGELVDAVGNCSLSNPSEALLASCQSMNYVAGDGYFENASPQFQEIALAADRAIDESLQSAGSSVQAPVQFVPPPDCGSLGRLHMPILFVRGESSPLGMRGGLDAFERCLPEHETRIIAAASHFVHLDATDAFNQAVLDFLGRN